MEERDDNQTIMKKYLLIALSLSILLLVFLSSESVMPE
jgi:hypothetical protein